MRLVAFLLGASLLSTMAYAEEPEAPEPGPLRTPVQEDAQVEDRLRWLESRLTSEAHSARLWESLWSVVDVGGAGYAVYELSKHETHGQTANGVVGLTKTAAGLLVLTILPLHATSAHRELKRRAEENKDRLDRLDYAEKALYRNAVDVELRFTWRPHVIGFLTNLAGAVVIASFRDWKRAGESLGIGIVGTEAQIWSRPWRARKDLRDYRRRFGDVIPPAPPPKAVLKLGTSSLSVTF